MTNPQDHGWLEKVTNHPKCPRCPSGYLNTRIHRSVIVKLLPLNLKRYQCGNCGAKVYIHVKPAILKK